MSAWFAVPPTAPPAFPVGRTEVTWTATDSSGNSVSKSRWVSVKESNTTPVANSLAGVQAISFEPLRIELTADDPDELGIRASLALLFVFVGVAIALGVEGILGAFLAGAVDLVYRDPDGALVVADYKTDAVADQTAIEERTHIYEAQVDAYGRILRVALGLEEDLHTELWFLAADKIVRL